MRWFGKLFLVCLALPAWHFVSAAGSWAPLPGDEIPTPMDSGASGASLDRPPHTHHVPAEVHLLRNQVAALWALVAARDITVEELRRRLFAALHQRDHWWAQLRWVWDRAHRDHTLFLRRLTELEAALALAHRDGHALAAQVADFRGRLQATLGQLGERERRIRGLEWKQAELRAALDTRSAELAMARQSLSELLVENSRLRTELALSWNHQPDEPEAAEKPLQMPRDGDAVVDAAALETVPAAPGVNSGAGPTANDLHALRVDRGYLEMRLRTVLAERETLQESLDSALAALHEARHAARSHRKEITALGEQAAALRSRLQRADEGYHRLTRERRADEELIGALRAEIARLNHELKSGRPTAPVAASDAGSRAALEELTRAVQTLEQAFSAGRAERPPQEDIPTRPESVRARAARLGDAYTAAYTAAELQSPLGAELSEGLGRLSDGLFMEQSLLARAVAASGVYTVLPRDSLSRISHKVYGSSRRWPDIYAANSHLLGNPDTLLPGLVLVIP
ncbi:MAG: LysM peptidoglycan-binding domain-containing protein [Gammaproteobacteria bacterium]|nr:LysM peptidoglycan-binding domain-containing protein [Gammaproteobacteria bacterium]